MSFVYRGLKADLIRHIVTDAEIDGQIQHLHRAIVPGVGDQYDLEVVGLDILERPRLGDFHAAEGFDVNK